MKFLACVIAPPFVKLEKRVSYDLGTAIRGAINEKHSLGNKSFSKKLG